MRLTLVIYSLGCGGSERVLTSLANAWQRAGHAVTVIGLTDGDQPPFYPLDPRVSLDWLAVARTSRHFLEAITDNIGRVRALRAAFRRARPDLVVSFLTSTNVLVLLSTVGRTVPVIVSERSNPWRDSVPRAWQWLRKRLYPRADAIVVQTRRTAEWFPPRIRSRIAVIPNAAPLPSPPRLRSEACADRGIVLGVGRLEHEKGFDLLVRAFAEATQRHRGWELVIAGDGSQRAALEAMAASCGVADRVRLPGTQADIGRVYAAADVFALPSRFEGFPNALLEAMAAGLPSVAADCPTGPREIIRDEHDGLLIGAEDVVAITGALSRLIGDPQLRSRLGAAGAEAVNRYSPDKIQSRWDALVADVAGRRPGTRSTGI